MSHERVERAGRESTVALPFVEVRLQLVEIRSRDVVRQRACLDRDANRRSFSVGEQPARLSGPSVGEIPFRIEGFPDRHGLVRFVLRGLFHRVLTVDTPPGRKLRRKVLRVSGVIDGRPRLEDGRLLIAANVIWCTGFRPGLDWIELPVLGDDGRPKHERGIVAGEPGLAFVGLHFQRSLSSTMVHGVGRDARAVAPRTGENAIIGRRRTRRSPGA